jgi:hypothetical protein
VLRDKDAGGAGHQLRKPQYTESVEIGSAVAQV